MRSGGDGGRLCPIVPFHSVAALSLLLSLCPPSLLSGNGQQPPQQQRLHSAQNTAVTWSATNSMFHNSSSSSEPSKTTASFVVYDGNFVNFECPNENDQWLVVSAVSEMSLIECQLDSTSTPFLICDDKNRRGKKLIFQREEIESALRRSGGGEERNYTNIEEVFYRKAGTSLYFISTSNGTNREGMWNSRGGLCALKNLRIRIEFSEDTQPSSTSTDGTTWIPLEYSIEEMPTWPIDPTKLGGKAKNGDDGEEMGEKDAHNRLAKSLRIKPEYLEFVRNHAIRGGTGDIRFPPTENDARDERVKWPRFVSRNSENSWRRARPSSLSTNSDAHQKVPEERHTDNELMKSERTRHKGLPPPSSPTLSHFPKDQLIWTTNESKSRMIPMRLWKWAIICIIIFTLKNFH
uniref:Ephrin RBD domain-containing protein n=1 Tax=Globodera rostochiensis TaxID=31243 RepID=A0A914H6F1_GLORO